MNAYDYIIVGAGSAGCVIANRLTEQLATSVLLLEAGGPDDRPEIHIPGATFSLQQTDIDWAYHTEPQTHLNGRSISWPRGKVLGGSSSINAMIYIRGHQRCYDEWEAAGNEGWGYEAVLPYFLKSEHQERGADAFHATGGPLNVADQRDPHPLSCALVDAAQELGIQRNPDFNGKKMRGFGLYQVTQKNGERWSAARALLQPALKRPNLQAITQAHVTRMVFNGRRATGVVYLKDGQTHQAQARHGVVLCGGAINSPQLLLLSGVGPAEQLQALGIPVIVDLPGVGGNLQDHLDVAVRYRYKEPSSQTAVDAEVAYRDQRKGPWSSNLVEAGGFVRTHHNLPVPDLQFHFAPQRPVGFVPTELDEHLFSFFPAILLPQSRGHITLRSPDPLAAPAIRPNYLSSQADLAVLVQGVKLARRLAQTRACAPFVGEAVQPGPEIQHDAAIGDYVREQADTIYHPAGTCKMGTDELAVVNPRLQVHGVTGLWVADASIMPTLVNGNTNAPVIMIGEKAADLIKATAPV
jgi:choline dehydrogenase